MGSKLDLIFTSESSKCVEINSNLDLIFASSENDKIMHANPESNCTSQSSERYSYDYDKSEIIHKYDAETEERWRFQKGHMWLSIISVFLGSLANGWALSAAGGTLTMPAMLQHFKWQINCVDITNQTQSDPLGITCAERYPFAEEWTKEEACLTCCCDDNPELNLSLLNGLVGSLGLWGSAVGSISIGPIADFGGRKIANLSAVAFMIAGNLFSGLAPSGTNMGMFYTGRFITGMSIGQLVTSAPLYLSELSPARLRGVLCNVSMIGLDLGMAIVSLYNVYATTTVDGWKWSYMGASIIAAISFCGMIFVVETPRWLISWSKKQSAERVLTKLRKRQVAADWELKLLQNHNGRYLKDKPWSLAKLKKGLGSETKRWRLTTMLVFHFMQQMSGVNAIGFFSPVIFNTFYDAETAAWGFVGQTFMKVIALSLGMFFIDKWGRIPQLELGGWTMTSTLFLVFFLSIPYNYDGVPTSEFQQGTPPYLNHESIGILIIAACWVYMFGFSYSWGGIPFLMTAEYLDQDMRSIGMSLCGFLSWSTAAIATLLFPYMIDHNGMDLWGTFLFFGCFTVIGNLFTRFCLIETKGIQMEDMNYKLTEFRKNNKLHRFIFR